MAQSTVTVCLTGGCQGPQRGAELLGAAGGAPGLGVWNERLLSKGPWSNGPAMSEAIQGCTLLVTYLSQTRCPRDGFPQVVFSRCEASS